MEDNNEHNILLVENNSINRRVMTRLLQNMDIIVVEAKDGEEAVEYALKEKFTMIFMELFMPKLSGFDTTKKIRKLSVLNKNTPVIAVTSNDYDSVSDEMIECGINDVISKPLRKEEVEKVFNDYINKDISSKSETSMDTLMFNVQEFESFYKDESLEKEIVQTFLDEKENDLNRINKAYNSKDLEQIYGSLHYMKGSFTYLKADKILKLTQEILDLSKLEKLNEVLLLKDAFYKNLDMLYIALNEYNNKK